MKLFLSRIDEINPILNCVTKTRATEALEEAAQIDQILAMKELPENFSLEKKPFLGVPFTTKEATSIKGISIHHFTTNVC